MINSVSRYVNSNFKENEVNYVSLKSSSYFNADRQQISNSENNSKTIANSPAAFMNAYDESILLSNLRKAKRMARQNPSNKALTDDQRYFSEVAKQQNALIADRLENGYSRDHTKQLGNYYVAPIHEKGLRSETLNTVASQLFLAAVPKAKDLRTNWGKGGLQTIGSKLLSMDEPYVEGNRDFLGFIRIDMDRVWDSPEQVLGFLTELVREGKIACLPHFLVGLKLPNGQYVRPHAIWMLPYGKAVFNQTDNPGFRRAPVEKFKSVYFGLCHALKDAGADAGAPAASQQVKNPLSPEFHTIPTQDSHFPDLNEHAEYLEMGHNRESLTRQQASIQSGFDIDQSNALFNFLQQAAYSIMNTWYFNADPEFARFRAENRTGAIADRLHIELERALAQSGIKPSKRDGNASHVIASVANYAAGSFNPNIASKKSNRGAAMHLVEGVKSAKERAQIGQLYAAKQNADRVRKLVFDAVIQAHEQGYDMNKTSISKIGNVSRPTVHKYWDEALANLVIYIESSKCKNKGMLKRYQTIRTTDLNKITSTTVVTGTVKLTNSACKVLDNDFDNDNGIIIRERVRNSYSEMRMKC